MVNGRVWEGSEVRNGRVRRGRVRSLVRWAEGEVRG